MLDRFRFYLKSLSVSPISWLLSISGILMVRFFLESISSPTTSGIIASDASTLIHYYLFFLFFAFGFMIFLYYFLPEWRHLVPKFTVFAFLGILLAPVIDFVISHGSGQTMTYLFDAPDRMFKSLISFFGPLGSHGITAGIRIEVAIILGSITGFIFAVSKSLKRSLFALVTLYLVIFVFLSLPGIISMVGNMFWAETYFSGPLTFITDAIKGSSTLSNNVHSTLDYSTTTRLFEIGFNFIMGKIIFVLLTVLVFVWFYINQKNKLIAIIKNSRKERVLHWIFMILLGFLTAKVLFPSLYLNWADYLSLLVLCFAFYFSWMFAVCVNDVVDVEIDKITNLDRPIIKNELDHRDMKEASFIFLTASLIGGYLAGFSAFFFILVFTALYYIYSAFPVRFKIIPFFSSFLISLCCLAAVFAGFMTFSPIKSVSLIPPRLIVAIVILYFLWSHIRDMKDIEGDRSAEIPTVPVIFGEKWGPRVVGILSSLSYLLVPIFLKYYFLFLPAILASSLNYYFIVRKPYSEKYIFRIYFGFVLSLIIIFSFF